MTADCWGETRNEEGVNRRICMQGVPRECSIKDIFALFGHQNLEGVAFVRKTCVCFVQFSRPYNYTLALEKRQVTFNGSTIKIRPYRVDSPPPKKKVRTVSSTSTRYIREASPRERDQRLIRDRSPVIEVNRESSRHRYSAVYTRDRESIRSREGSSKEREHDRERSYTKERDASVESRRTLDDGWGTPAPRLHRRTSDERYNDEYHLKRRASNTSNGTTDPPTRENEKIKLEMSNGDLWVEDWSGGRSSGGSPKNHLQLVKYGPNPTTATHMFGQQASGQSQLQQAQATQLPIFDQRKLICSNAEQASLTTTNITYSDGNINTSDGPLQTLRDPVELLLKLILAQKSAQGLSVLQINLIQEYLEKEKQAIQVNVATLATQARPLTPPQKQAEPYGNDNNNAVGDNSSLDPIAKKLRDKLKSLQK